MFVHTPITHKRTFYALLGASVFGRAVTALPSNLSFVDSQSAELYTICYWGKPVAKSGKLLHSQSILTAKDMKAEFST